MNLLDFLFPPKCVCCDGVMIPAEKMIREKGGDALCPGCRAEWEMMKTEKCSSCGLAIMDCRCATFLMRKNGYRNLIKLCAYKGEAECAVKKLIFCLKKSAHKKCEVFLATQLSYPIKRYIREHGESDFCITNVPRREKNVINYGYDHSEVLARRIAKLCSIPYFPLIDRVIYGTDQKNLTYEQRLINTHKVFKISKHYSEKAKGMTVIMVDDVVTTGASIVACMETLKASGFDEAVAACIAATARKRSKT